MECKCCNSDKIIKKGKKSGFNIYICKKCKFEFVYPVPPKIELEKYYNTELEYDKQAISKSISDISSLPRHPHRDWYDLILKKAKKYTGKGQLKILDIGAAHGYFVHYANNIGHDTIGTEISEKIANASKGIINGELIYIKNNDYSSYFETGVFDLIYMEHVFEHLDSPVEFIELIKPLLSDNGIIFNMVPNQNCILSKAFGLKWDWVSPPLHLYYYNRKNLSLLFQKKGFKEVETWTGDYFFHSIPQFYLTDKVIFRLKQISNKYLKTNFTINYRNKKPSYMYPGSFSEILKLIPYYFLYPVIKISGILLLGSEMSLIFKKDIK